MVAMMLVYMHQRLKSTTFSSKTARGTDLAEILGVLRGHCGIDGGQGGKPFNTRCDVRSHIEFSWVRWQ